MPDSRSHRGPHPQDHELFAPRYVPDLRAAAGDLSWLLSRGYGSKSALKLVGDRYRLTARQREAVGRCSCSEEARRSRQERLAEGRTLEELWIDGFNVLLTLEAALGGAPVFVGRDGCLRDIASVHGSYRTVQETHGAAELLTEELVRRGVRCVRLLLDAPVSNSGRLASALRDQWRARSGEQPWDWDVVLVRNADRALLESQQTVASADGDVLDRASGWINLARAIVERRVPTAFWIDLSEGPP